MKKQTKQTYFCMQLDNNQAIGLMSRVFVNSLGDRGLIPC